MKKSLDTAYFSSRIHDETLPKLSREQMGHIRHIIRIAQQPDGEWAYMGPYDPTHEGIDAFRYQLAYMVYGLSLAQYHRTPAYQELYKKTLKRLINKMIRYDVWSYWELTSRGSKLLNPALEKLKEGNIDPVIRQNIMYSGHLLMMVGLYEMLYNDDSFDQPGSINFEFRPIFRGFERQNFPYDHSRLTQVIYSEFERNNYLGVECEPNTIFIFCNQFPTLGFIHYDYLHGTNITEKVLPRFLEAWKKKSDMFISTDPKDIPTIYALEQQAMITRSEVSTIPGVLGVISLMNAYLKDYAKELYPKVRDNTAVFHSDGAIGVNMEEVQSQHLQYLDNSMGSLTDPVMIGVHSLGMFAMAASEMGDHETLHSILKYADTRLNPVWENGCLYYERNDDISSEGYTTRLTGNALLAYSRLNVKDGLWDLYNKPWGEEQQSLQISGVPFPNILIERACIDRGTGALVVGTLPGNERTKNNTVSITGIKKESTYSIEVDDQLVILYQGSSNITSHANWASVAFDEESERMNLTMDFSVPRKIIIGELTDL